MDATQSMLLRMPGEIRNHIHSFAIESHPTMLFAPNQSSTIGPSGITTFGSPRQYHALTQVCRQIRSEYLPIYWYKNPVHIHFSELTLYLDTFYRRSLQRSSPPVGNIAIDYGWGSSNCEPILNLLPIIQLCRNAPDLLIRQGLPYGARPNEVFNNLINIAAYPALSQYLDETVEAVIDDEEGISIGVKDEHYKNWMDGSTLEDWILGVRERDEWFTQQGLLDGQYSNHVGFYTLGKWWSQFQRRLSLGEARMAGFKGYVVRRTAGEAREMAMKLLVE